MSGKPSSLTSVVLLVDASLTVAEEWQRILSEFVSPITQRLASEIHPESEMRMGFVAYGAPDEPQGVIVGQRFFGSPQALLAELGSNYRALGIGCGSATGPDGLTALDGYACALEMFDLQRHTADFQPLRPITLNADKEQPKPLERHDYIVHVAAADTDGATQPRFNDSVALDELNWATLPGEISKRKLHVCMDLLRPVKEFVDLFNAVSEGPRSTPWFSLPPNHTTYLYGFPPPRSKPKRLSDVERSPAAKRPRIKDASSPSSPTKAASPHMAAAVVKTPKQAPATVPKAPTPTAPPASAPEPQSVPTPPPQSTPAPPAPQSAFPPAPQPPQFAPPVTVTPAPATAAAAPGRMQTGSFLAKAGFYTEIQAHPRFEAGLQNPQQRELVDTMRKMDPVFFQHVMQTAGVRRANPANPALPQQDARNARMRAFLELGIAALRRWCADGVPALINDVKERAGLGAPPPPQAPPPGAPHAQDMMAQMDEISKSDIQRRNMLPPSTPGGGARPAFAPPPPAPAPAAHQGGRR